MSPSRRRAIGAVRGVASREIRTRIYRTRPRGTAHGPGGAMVGRRDSRLAPRDTRGDEARETKVGWAVFLREQNNSDRMES